MNNSKHIRIFSINLCIFNSLKITAMNEFVSMDQVFIRKLTEIVLKNLTNENFDVDELAMEAGIGRYTIHRRLRSIRHQSVSQFIREIRLQRAMEMLRNNVALVSEIAYMVGFGSPTYFNKCFHEYYGYPPGEVKKGYPEILETDQEVGSSGQSIPNNKLSHKERIKPIWNLKKSLFIIGSIFLIISIGLILVFDMFSFFRKNDLTDIIAPDGRISIAVIPFQNMTNDTIWNIWQNGIKDELINYLTNYSEYLSTRQAESVDNLTESIGFTNYTSITPFLARAISRKLDANLFITGSIKPAGDKIRVNAQIIDTKSNEYLKAFQIDGQAKEDNILPIIDSLRIQISKYLLITLLQKDNVEFQKITSTHSPDAYRCFINAKDARYKYEDHTAALKWGLKALEIDSNFTWAMFFVCTSYSSQGNLEEYRKWVLRYISKKDIMNNPMERIWSDIGYQQLFGTTHEEIKYLKQLQEIDDQSPFFCFNLGSRYLQLHQFDRAIPEYEKALKIYKKWDLKPLSVGYYSRLGYAYHKTGQYKKEKKLYKKAEGDFPDNYRMLQQQVILALSEGRIKAANEYIERYKSICKENSSTVATIASNLGDIYTEAEILDSADYYYHKAMTLEPENPLRKHNLAYFLIDKDRNINEGLKLIDEILEVDPQNYDYLDTKGWGLYKNEAYQEAHEILRKSWDIRRKKAIFNDEAYLHLQAAKKKAVEGQDNN
jgi:AraC-like DNA-binding protein/TolB-like protein/tetratricopeptide (TPR) repeat protein